MLLHRGFTYRKRSGALKHLLGMEIAASARAGSSYLAGLLAQVRDRDETAFTTLVGLLDADLVRLAFVVTTDLELAQDAAQSAWERLWRNPPELREPDRLRSWLLTVAANEARGMARRRRRGRELEEGRATGGSADPGEIVADVDLHRAIQQLSPDDRSLIGLRYVIGLSAPEIAPHLGLSPEGVRTRLRRALARLREELDHDHQ